MNKDTELLCPGMVVQLSPETKNVAFACCCMVVTDVKPWGAQGYVQLTGDRKRGTMGSQVHYRAEWDEMEIVGAAQWVAE